MSSGFMVYSCPLFTMTAFGDGFAANSPIVGFNFIKDYDSSLRIFPKDFGK
jgi:hypothetical protein